MPRVAIDEVQRICLAVSRDGDYRIVRTTSFKIQRLHGKLAKEQFDKLKALLESEDFGGLSGDHGGLIRQEAETFTAEISTSDEDSEDTIQRLQWLSADGERPFPASVVKVIDWLKHFDAKDGKHFEYANYPDVCPSRGLRLVQPTVATNDQP